MNLISGKEALIALANGEEVEYLNVYKQWDSAACAIAAMDILDDKFKFRLKPSTITLNGIEVPAPFDPKNGDFVWTIQSSGKNGYFGFKHDNGNVYTIGVWRTEEEIKQVVNALRKVFKEPQQ